MSSCICVSMIYFRFSIFTPKTRVLRLIFYKMTSKFRTDILGNRKIKFNKIFTDLSLEGAKALCRIRSYISSAKKQGIRASYALRSLFEGKDVFEGRVPPPE